MSRLKSHCLWPKIAMVFFDSLITLSSDIRVHRAGSQLKILLAKVAKYGVATFVFMSMLQKSLFIAENCNGVFFYLLIALSCYFRVHRAGSQLKMSERQTRAGKQEHSLIHS